MIMGHKTSDTEIGSRPPRRVHCGLRTKALLLFDFRGGLQHRHLKRGDREPLNHILWGLLGSSARSTDTENCQNCRSQNQDLPFHGCLHVADGDHFVPMFHFANLFYMRLVSGECRLAFVLYRLYLAWLKRFACAVRGSGTIAVLFTPVFTPATFSSLKN